jgi:hypothetical protein
MYGRRAPTNRRSSRPPPSRPHRSPWPNCSKSSAAGPANVGDFAAAFTASPDVSARHLPGAGHNIDHHLAGRQYRADVLDWAVELAAR